MKEQSFVIREEENRRDSQCFVLLLYSCNDFFISGTEGSFAFWPEDNRGTDGHVDPATSSSPSCGQ